MITITQAEVLRKILERFNKSEELPWTEFDENMVYLAYLEDEQLVVEAQIMLEKHIEKNAHCTHEHPREECFVPVIMQGVAYILDAYENKAKLVKTTRYLLQYYISLAQTEAIIHD